MTWEHARHVAFKRGFSSEQIGQEIVVVSVACIKGSRDFGWSEAPLPCNVDVGADIAAERLVPVDARIPASAGAG